MSILTTEQFVELMMKWGNFKARCKSDFSKSEEAKRNEELRDKHKGKRCFIIGNGPSIKTQDLRPLADEIVFVTNGFYRYEKYYNVKPDYYCIVDALMFSEEGSALLEGIDRIKDYDHKPAFILPYGTKELIHDRFKWNEWTSVYYLDGGMSFTDGYDKKWDITKVVASPQNVVQVAMLLATYMGFGEIYLLGIEQTDLIAMFQKQLGENVSYYAYEKNRNDQLVYENVQSRITLEENLRGYTRIFHLYKEIYNYCKKQGISVYNCTPATLVDSIPQKRYEDLF